MNRDKVMTFLKKSLRFLPDKSYIKLYYRLRVGRKLNMDNPTTLNEKLQWMKFNYRFPLQSIVSDKLLVRDYVKEKIGEEYLIPLLGSWKDYEDIDLWCRSNRLYVWLAIGRGRTRCYVTCPEGTETIDR